MDSGRQNTTRRSVLKLSSGMLVTGLFAGSAAASGPEYSSQDDSIDEFHTQLVEAYNKQEADEVVQIVSMELEAYSRGQRTKREAFNRATERILRNPKTEQISEDISNHIEINEQHRKQLKRYEEQLKLSANSPSLSPASTQNYSTYIDIWDGETGSSTSMISGDADVNYSVDDQTVQEFSRASVYGSATGWARIYGSHYTGDGGNVKITASYYRRGRTTATIGDANTDVYIFIRDEDDDVSKTPIESPTWVDGDNSGTAQFYLSDSTLYNVGIEVRGDVSAIGEYTYSDFATTDSGLEERRVELDNFGLELEYM